MRFNKFLRQDGGAYGTFVCTLCSKNIILEQEELPAENAYGQSATTFGKADHVFRAIADGLRMQLGICEVSTVQSRLKPLRLILLRTSFL
jgi:hypothetical protein